MGTQNLVSAALTAEQSAVILQGIQSIKNGLPMLIILQPGQKKEFIKVGNTYLPFIELAHQVSVEHPEILSRVFDIEEFNRDFQLPKDLTPILTQLEELTEAVQDTIFAASSDAMAESLEVYAAVQDNKDKIPGMDTVAAKMASFFKKTKREPAAVLSAEEKK